LVRFDGRSAMSDYIDDGNLRIYRHRPEPCRAFEAVLNFGDRANGLVIGTQDGCHDAEIVLRVHRNATMMPVIRVRGEAAPDGRLQVTVTNLLTGEQLVAEGADA
jgi:hypothetical protein